MITVGYNSSTLFLCLHALGLKFYKFQSLHILLIANGNFANELHMWRNVGLCELHDWVRF